MILSPFSSFSCIFTFNFFLSISVNPYNMCFIMLGYIYINTLSVLLEAEREREKFSSFSLEPNWDSSVEKCFFLLVLSVHMMLTLSLWDQLGNTQLLNESCSECLEFWLKKRIPDICSITQFSLSLRILYIFYIKGKSNRYYLVFACSS